MGINLSTGKLLNGFKMKVDVNGDNKVTLDNDNVEIFFTISRHMENRHMENIELHKFNIKKGSCNIKKGDSCDILKFSFFVILRELRGARKVRDSTEVKMYSPINPNGALSETLTLSEAISEQADMPLDEDLNNFYKDMGFESKSEDGHPNCFSSTVQNLIKTLGDQCDSALAGGKYKKTKSKRRKSKKRRKTKYKKSRKRKSKKRRKTRRFRNF